MHRQGHFLPSVHFRSPAPPFPARATWACGVSLTANGREVAGPKGPSHGQPRAKRSDALGLRTRLITSTVRAAHLKETDFCRQKAQNTQKVRPPELEPSRDLFDRMNR